METLILIFLILAYTLGISSLILQIVCFQKDLEYLETIIFSIAFLLLIVSVTVQHLVQTGNAITDSYLQWGVNLFTVFFTVSIPINIHKERIDTFRKVRNRIVVWIGLGMILYVGVFTFVLSLKWIIVGLSVYIYLSVAYSMLFILFTKPGALIQFREKWERLIAMMILFITTPVFLFMLV